MIAASFGIHFLEVETSQSGRFFEENKYVSILPIFRSVWNDPRIIIIIIG